MAALMEREAAKRRTMTPLEEYASSIDQAVSVCVHACMFRYRC